MTVATVETTTINVQEYRVLREVENAYAKLRSKFVTAPSLMVHKAQADEMQRELEERIRAIRSGNFTEGLPITDPVIPIAQFSYRNHDGKMAVRRVHVLGFRWGTTEYYTVPQFLLRGIDLEKNVEREFALAGMGVPLEMQGHPVSATLEMATEVVVPGELDQIRAMVPMLQQLAAIIHNLNRKWWQDLQTGEPIERNVGEMLCLVHSEISEAMEGHRRNRMDDKLPQRRMIEVELADAMIRILDMSTGLGLDIASALAEKTAYNTTRADHSHEARLADGGKKV